MFLVRKWKGDAFWGAAGAKIFACGAKNSDFWSIFGHFWIDFLRKAYFIRKAPPFIPKSGKRGGGFLNWNTPDPAQTFWLSIFRSKNWLFFGLKVGFDSFRIVRSVQLTLEVLFVAFWCFYSSGLFRKIDIRNVWSSTPSPKAKTVEINLCFECSDFLFPLLNDHSTTGVSVFFICFFTDQKNDFSEFGLFLNQNIFEISHFCPPQAIFLNILRLKNDFSFIFRLIFWKSLKFSPVSTFKNVHE